MARMTLHKFIMREVASTGQLKQIKPKLKRDMITEIINLVQQYGFVDDGKTRVETYKIITQASHPLPGAIINPGGRTRLKNRNNDWKVTVGQRTTNFYQVIESQVENLHNFKTLSIAEIEEFLKANFTELHNEHLI